MSQRTVAAKRDIKGIGNLISALIFPNASAVPEDISYVHSKRRLRACDWWAGGGGVGVGVRGDARARARLNWEGPKCPSQQHTTALRTSVCMGV